MTGGRTLLAVLVASLVALTAACAPTPAPTPSPAPVPAVPPQAWANLPYASASPTQVLDLWVPGQGARPYPLVIFVHGGGYAGGDKQYVGPKLVPLLNAGFAVASVNYRLSGEARFPGPAHDVQSAVRQLRAHAGEYGIDPARVALWGESAGANLSALVGVIGDRPSVLDDPTQPPAASAAVQAVVEWYGPTRFASIPSESAEAGCPPWSTAEINGFVTGYLGADPAVVPQVAAAADPVTYVPTAPSLPPFSIAHGTDDCLVPPAQAGALVDALAGRGMAPDVHVADGLEHADPRFDTELMAPTITWLSGVLRR